MLQSTDSNNVWWNRGRFQRNYSSFDHIYEELKPYFKKQKVVFYDDWNPFSKTVLSTSTSDSNNQWWNTSLKYYN